MSKDLTNVFGVGALSFANKRDSKKVLTWSSQNNALQRARFSSLSVAQILYMRKNHGTQV
jgi:hypothetical protein